MIGFCQKGLTVATLGYGSRVVVCVGVIDRAMRKASGRRQHAELGSAQPSRASAGRRNAIKLSFRQTLTQFVGTCLAARSEARTVSFSSQRYCIPDHWQCAECFGSLPSQGTHVDHT